VPAFNDQYLYKNGTDGLVSPVLMDGHTVTVYSTNVTYYR
jgi:hypothetical protein